MNVNSSAAYKDITEDSKDPENTGYVNHKTTMDEDEKPFTPEKSKYWILTAVLASIFFAMGNVFIGKVSHYGMYSRILIGVGALIFSSVYSLTSNIIQMYRNYRAFKPLISTSESDFYDSQTGKFSWRYCLIILFDAIITLLIGFVVIWMFQLALYGKLNQGIITSLFSMTTIYLAIFSYFMFDEKLHVFHFIGMAWMIACAVMISFSKETSQDGVIEVFGDIIEEISPVWGVLVAILTTLMFFIRTVAIKFWFKWYQISPMNLTMNSYIFQGIFMLIALFCLEYAPTEVLIEGMLGGGLSAVGNVLINHATTKGYAGPAAALANIQTIVQIIVDAILFSQIPNGLQIGGWILAIWGSLMISIGPSVLNYVHEKLSSTI